MRVFAVDQGSPEWLQLRTGVATASRAEDVLATLKSGAPAKARQDYACELAIERITGSMVEHFVNGAMQRGTDLEPEARAAYEAMTGELVDQVGFCLHDSLAAGASPDGLIGADGLLEIKCPQSQIKIAQYWATGDVSEYLPQVHWQMWITGRAWCDLVIYDPRMARAGYEVFHKRIDHTEDWNKRLSDAVPLFLDEVAAIETAIKQKRAA